MPKKNAAAILSLLVLSLVAVNVVAMPQLAVFFDAFDMDTGYSVGKTVGGALGKAFGSDLFEFIGVILFLA